MGCSEESQRDSPRDDITDNSIAKIIRMPDGYPNIATKCIPGTDIRVATAGHRSISMVQDKTCGVK